LILTLQAGVTLGYMLLVQGANTTRTLSY